MVQGRLRSFDLPLGSTSSINYSIARRAIFWQCFFFFKYSSSCVTDGHCNLQKKNYNAYLFLFYVKHDSAETGSSKTLFRSASSPRLLVRLASTLKSFVGSLRLNYLYLFDLVAVAYTDL